MRSSPQENGQDLAGACMFGHWWLHFHRNLSRNRLGRTNLAMAVFIWTSSLCLLQEISGHYHLLEGCHVTRSWPLLLIGFLLLFVWHQQTVNVIPPFCITLASITLFLKKYFVKNLATSALRLIIFSHYLATFSVFYAFHLYFQLRLHFLS